MEPDHPLTLTVEDTGRILGVGRSTAYELVRNGELASLRLRRRIVVPVAGLAETLGVDLEAVWHALRSEATLKPAGLPYSRPNSDGHQEAGG